jgi:bifunctional UDP-N-acetylglucosamine pyrophosphorylase/glucosamine-1-phosphate N-acetyltransferase
LINRSWLENPVLQLPIHEDKKEYYITDLAKLACDQEYRVETITAPFDHVRGINTYRELWTVEQIKRSELISHWMNHGVRFYAAQAVHVDVDVSIGAGTYIGCGVHVLRGTQIGKNCTIEAFSILDNAKIADNVIVHSHSVIKDSIIESEATIGPFAHLRNETHIGSKVQIGNFVEIKQSLIDHHTSIKHLSYIGDATVGNHVNIGAGTITCNYNGSEKQKTIIQDHAFIGSNNTLIAPVTIGENAYTAGGSVITEPVPDQALAIGRARQINKEYYAPKLKSKIADSLTNTPEEQTQSFFGAMKSSDITPDNQSV